MLQEISQTATARTIATLDDRTVRCCSIDNARDLGGVKTSDGLAVRRGLLFRGGALGRLSTKDAAALYNGLGIGTVIDLRCGWEVQAQPDTVVSHVTYHRIPLYDQELVGLEYTKPAPGTIAIGRDIACDIDDYYRSLSNQKTSRQIGKAVRCMLDSAVAGVPVYAHCSNGKDRVGAVSFIALTVLGATYDEAVADYVLTNASRDAKRQQVLERFLRLAQGNHELAQRLVDSHRALPQHIAAYCESIDQRYGGMHRYLRDGLGLDECWQERAREALTRRV